MTFEHITEEEIERNWETFKAFSEKTGNYNKRQEYLKDMLDILASYYNFQFFQKKLEIIIRGKNILKTC